MTPYFSVILPVYNVENYLERCVRSVESQSFPDYELILVDDGATDASGRICDDLAAQYDNITVVHKENGGLSSARNAGLKLAKGEYIWFVDSDDWIEPDALLQLYELTAAQKPELVKFNYYRVQSQRTAVCSKAAPGLYTNEQTQILCQMALCDAGRFILSAWSYLYRREFLRKHSLQFISERQIGSEDYLFNLQALLLAQSIQVTSCMLYSYEQRDGSLTQRYRPELPEKYTRLYTLLRDFCEKVGILQQYEGKICRFYVWHLLHGTCITNAYTVTPDHSLAEGRREVRAFLGTSECRYALARCDKTHMTKKQRIQLMAMRLPVEPMFYRLWKGKRK